MARFSDSVGFEWDLRLSRGILPDLKRAGFDLDRATKEADWLADVLFGSADTLAEALWVLLAEQAQRAGLDRNQFDRRLDVETLDRAGKALLDEILDFFHRGRSHHIKARLPRILAELDAKMGTAADRALEASIRSISESSATSLPASSASIPGP